MNKTNSKSNRFKYNQDLIYEYLPSNLIDSLTLLFDQYRDCRSRDNLVLIVSIIFHKNCISEYVFHPLSAEYWKKVIGTHYGQYLSSLIMHKIIESCCLRYEAEDGTLSMVKGFRINESLLNETFAKIMYESGKDTAEQVDNDFDGSNKLKLSGFYVDSITIKKREALVWISENIPSIIAKYLDFDFVTGLPSSSRFGIKILKDNDQYRTYHLSIEQAQKIANKSNKKLFYFKNKFIIADTEQFEKLTLERLRHHYKLQVLRYLPDKLTFFRNEKTLRVYNRLTSLPSALLQFIKINGDYVCQADLKCSQFTLLGNLFNYYINHSGKELSSLFKKKPTKTFVSRMVAIMGKYNNLYPSKGYPLGCQENIYNPNDVYTFLEDTLKNDFYTILKSNLGLPHRKYAKNIAFETLFSSGKRESYYAAQLKRLYPTVMNIIKEFKDVHGYENFSVGLQNIESEIFIDHIWKKVTDKGITSFTRHDSLLFPLKKTMEVKSIINNVFNSFYFKHKIEYEEFDTKDMWQRFYDESGYLDSLEEEVDEGMLYEMNNKLINNNAVNNNAVNNNSANIESVSNNSRDLESISIESDNLEEDDMEEDDREEEINEEDREALIFEQIQDFNDDPDSEFKLPTEIKDDYFDCVNRDTIEYLASLDYVEQDIIDALEIDYIRMNSFDSEYHFQEKTNEFITYLVERKDKYLDDEDDGESDENDDPEYDRF